MPGWQDRYRGSGSGVLPDEAALAGGALAGGALAGAGLGPQASTGGSPAATPARPYGRILIFTLLDERVADFDRLAEQTAEEIRLGEPDTLVYVIHLVPNAPMQRIFYEIYRDRAAFERHESQPHIQRFVTERRSCVLATNVIELRLKYAKVAPRPGPHAPAGPRPVSPGPGERTQLPAGPSPRTQPSPAGQATGPLRIPGVSGPQGTQRLQPLPPARPPRPGQPRPHQPRPDQRWADRRQVPSADHYYRG